MEVARDLRCIQVDPINVVARTQLLVLFSRLGRFDPLVLDEITWSDKTLFHYWAHAASLVLTEDYPIHRVMMRTWPAGEGAWVARVEQWLADNEALRRSIVRQLRRNGPMRSRDFKDAGAVGWRSSGWTDGRTVNRMLEFLWVQGKVMIAGRRGMDRIWDLTANFLPEWTPRESLSERRSIERAVPSALKALGVATPRHIREHFIRGRYSDLPSALGRLQRRKVAEAVNVRSDGTTLPGPWYIHSDDLALIDALDDEWEPRTVLLSPFDNLICDRARTGQIFDFEFRIEIYVPAAKRRYGYYVLSILHGDRLIGRVDPKMDRARNTLVVNAVHAEEGAAPGRTTGDAVADAIESLADFLGAGEIEYRGKVPEGWRRSLMR